MKILITGAASAAAHRLKSKLNADEVILGDHVELPAFMLQSGNMLKLPNPASDAYTHQMLTLCLDNAITRVYAIGEEEFKILSLANQLFNEYDIEILNSTNEI